MDNVTKENRLLLGLLLDEGLITGNQLERVREVVEKGLDVGDALRMTPLVEPFDYARVQEIARKRAKTADDQGEPEPTQRIKYSELKIGGQKADEKVPSPAVDGEPEKAPAEEKPAFDSDETQKLSSLKPEDFHDLDEDLDQELDEDLEIPGLDEIEAALKDLDQESMAEEEALLRKKQLEREKEFLKKQRTPHIESTSDVRRLAAPPPPETVPRAGLPPAAREIAKQKGIRSPKEETPPSQEQVTPSQEEKTPETSPSQKPKSSSDTGQVHMDIPEGFVLAGKGPSPPSLYQPGSSDEMDEDLEVPEDFMPPDFDQDIDLGDEFDLPEDPLAHENEITETNLPPVSIPASKGTAQIDLDFSKIIGEPEDRPQEPEKKENETASDIETPQESAEPKPPAPAKPKIPDITEEDTGTFDSVAPFPGDTHFDVEGPPPHTYDLANDEGITLISDVNQLFADALDRQAAGFLLDKSKNIISYFDEEGIVLESEEISAEKLNKAINRIKVMGRIEAWRQDTTRGRCTILYKGETWRAFIESVRDDEGEAMLVYLRPT